MAEPTFATKEMRETMVQYMFEHFGVPALFLAKNAALSSFAVGRQTSLVIDLGHEGTVGTCSHIVSCRAGKQACWHISMTACGLCLPSKHAA